MQASSTFDYQLRSAAALIASFRALMRFHIFDFEKLTFLSGVALDTTPLSAEVKLFLRLESILRIALELCPGYQRPVLPLARPYQDVSTYSQSMLAPWWHPPR